LTDTVALCFQFIPGEFAHINESVLVGAVYARNSDYLNCWHFYCILTYAFCNSSHIAVCCCWFSCHSV